MYLTKMDTNLMASCLVNLHIYQFQYAVHILMNLVLRAQIRKVFIMSYANGIKIE